LVDLKTPKGHFEINWPLDDTENLVEEKLEDFNSTIQDFEKRSSLLYVPETCAQLTLLGVLASPTKKEKIDPDGRSVNNLPIQVSFFKSFKLQ
jgi:hypothetical protein